MESIKKYIDDLRKGHGVQLLMLLLGLIFLIYPGAAQQTLAYIIGAAFVILGIVKILSYFKKPAENAEGYMEYPSKSVIVIGIVYIVLAALIAKVLLSIIPIILGIIILLNGIIKLNYAVDVRKENGKDGWTFMMITSVLMIILGTVILFNPFKTNNLILRIIGGFLVFDSLADLLAGVRHK